MSKLKIDVYLKPFWFVAYDKADKIFFAFEL
jgi:hypothetical protein